MIVNAQALLINKQSQDIAQLRQLIGIRNEKEESEFSHIPLKIF